MTVSVIPRSRFTPSVMPHGLLERLFVARERTLEAILARIRAGAVSPERNHTLLVGPRGSGKTHLVSLAYHRTNILRTEGVQLQIAWLPEDGWTIVSYRHLLRAIAQRLEPRLEKTIPASTAELEAFLARRAADGGPIVVIVENLDQILDAIEAHGQQQFRHLLQADRSLLLVATSTRLDRTLSDQASPFYGFFTTTRLEPFSTLEAAAMLTAIAMESGDEALVAYLSTEKGRARLRTITHLAGGQPRMWAVLASALTVRGLAELLDLLLTRFDDLTPYYQEQLGRLSGQQRLVVAELAGVDRPINVSELADRLELSQRSLGKTMSDLVERGWVAPTISVVTPLLDQRRTYYELAEPLARVSFQIKESRGEPLRVVVEFLKHWFDPVDLTGVHSEGIALEYVLLAAAGQQHDQVVVATRLLQRLPITRAPAVTLLGEIDDALAALTAGDPEPFIRLPTPVRAALEERLDTQDPTLVRSDVHSAALDDFGHVHHAAMGPWISRAEDWVTSASASGKAAAQQVLADWLGRAWRFDEAQEVLTAVADHLGSDHPVILSSHAKLAESYVSAGHAKEAIAMQEAVVADSVRLLGEEQSDTLHARMVLARYYLSAFRIKDAIAMQEVMLADIDRLVGEEHPLSLSARESLAGSYGLLGRTEEAIKLEEGVLTNRERLLGDEHLNTLTARENLAKFYLSAGRSEEATVLLERTLADHERLSGDEHLNTLTARENLAKFYLSVGRSKEAIVLLERMLADRERLLGDEHPNTLTARENLATSYISVGRNEEATALLERTLADHERLLGDENVRAASSRILLATSYLSAGRIEEAVALEEHALGDLERLFGEEHETTLSLRAHLATRYRSVGRTEDAIVLEELAIALTASEVGTSSPPA